MILKLKTGNVKIELFPDVAPNHVERIKELANSGKYDNVVFHRVIDGFMAQTGDVKFGNSSDDNFNLQRAGMGGSNLPDLVFYACGVFIGGMGGTLQSASRSMMVRHTTRERATEGFGLYALSGRATAFLAPTLIGIVTAISGDARIGISPLVALFIIGLILLLWVNPKGETETWDTTE